MAKINRWILFVMAFGLVLSGCSIPNALNKPKATLTQEITLPAVAQTASPIPPIQTATIVPPTQTPTLVPPTPPPTLVPVTPADLVFSELDYLPIKSVSGSGKILGWVKNPMASPVKDIKVSFFYTKDGKKVPLIETTAKFVGPGQRVFIWASIHIAVPEGAELGAEAVKLTAADPRLTAVTLETRGLYTMAFPNAQSTFITGELSNPTNQAVTTWGTAVLWYNSDNKLVHVSALGMVGYYVAPQQAVPFRIDAAFKISQPDAGVPASELKRYELIVNTNPVGTWPAWITFKSVSTPFLIKADQTMNAFGEATNTADQWQDVNAFWAGYNEAGQVIGMFRTSMLGSIVAPGETRPMQFVLSLPGGLKPDQKWASQVTRAVMIDNFTQSTEPQLTLQVNETKVEPWSVGYSASMHIQNTNTVEVSETSIVVSITDRATGKLLWVKEGRIVMGDKSDVIYAKPLAAGQSWPVQSYFELPLGVTLDMVDISYNARGK